MSKNGLLALTQWIKIRLSTQLLQLMQQHIITHPEPNMIKTNKHRNGVIVGMHCIVDSFW